MNTLLNKCKCDSQPRYVRADPKMPREFPVRVQCGGCGAYTIECKADWLAATAWNAQRGVTYLP
jgi:hypothetical protein